MDWKEIIRKRIDVEGLLVEDVLIGLVFKKLDELAADSENTLDDTLLAFIKPEVEKYVREQLDDLLDKHLADDGDE